MKKLLQIICFIATGSIAIGQNVGIGNATPSGKLHVRNGASGAVQTTSTVPVGIFENNDHTYLELFSPSDRRGGINFRSPAFYGKIEYNHPGQSMTFFNNSNFPIMSLLSDRAYFGDAEPNEFSAIVNISRTDKGFLIPRLTALQRNAISTPANGLTVYDIDSASYMLKTPAGWTKFLLSNTDLFWKRSGNNIFNSNSAFVGINTSSPAAMLHVKDSNVLFSGGASLPSETGLPPASGAGTRMMWYPNKAAFRAGSVTANEWDAGNTGIYSFGAGNGTKASGASSVAMGQNTIASNSVSTAFGNGTVASGIISTALGNATQASGVIATAFGNGTTASGAEATAMGETTIASGTYSTAMGKSTLAVGEASLAVGTGSSAIGYSSVAAGEFTKSTGDHSTALGTLTTARAYASLSIGQYNDSIITSTQGTWIASDPVFIIGNGIASNSRKNAITVLKNGKTGINTSAPLAMLHVKDSSVVFTGQGTLPFTPGPTPVSGSGIRMMWYPDKAAFRAGSAGISYWDKNFIGVNSFASGNNTLAQGEASVALGDNTEATGPYSIALGRGTQATGGSSTAMGHYTYASGMSSTALGNNAWATGNNSIAMGSGSTASGFSSTAMGSNTAALSFASAAMGTGTLALGDASAAMGANSKATGANSTAMGFNTTSRAYSSLTIGQHNDSIITGSPTGWVATDPAFIIGNGTANNARSNAMVVYKNGNTDINGNLKLNSGNAATGAVLTAIDNLGNSSWQQPIGFLSSMAADVPIANNSFVNLIFNSQQLDDGGDNFNPVTGIYTTPSAGMYEFEVSVYWSGLTATENVYLTVNGARTKFTSTPIATGVLHTQKLSSFLKLTAGTQVAVQVQQNSGAPVIIDNAGGGTYFSGVRVY